MDVPNAVLNKIADYYNVSTDYILARTDIKKPYEKKTKER